MGLGNYFLNLVAGLIPRAIQLRTPEYRELDARLGAFEQDEDNASNTVLAQGREIEGYKRLNSDYQDKIADLNFAKDRLEIERKELEKIVDETRTRNSELGNSLELERAARSGIEEKYRRVEKERDDARKLVSHFRVDRRNLFERMYTESAKRNPRAFAVFIDHKDKIASVSEQVLRASGYSEEQLVGKEGYSFLVDSATLKAKLQLSVSPEGETAISLPRTKFILPNGKVTSFDLVAERIFKPDFFAKEKYQYVGTWIREETKAERRSRLYEERKGINYVLSGLAAVRDSLSSVFRSRERSQSDS